MSKTKKSEAPQYELLYIVSNTYTAEELKPIMDKVNKIITDNGGQILRTEEWGNKKLAYPIKHQNYGYYNLVEFTTPGEKMQKISHVFRITSEILRYQIVVKEIKKEAANNKEKERARERAVRAKEDEKKKNELEKEKTKTRVNMLELDEKLDKILETDDLL
ncbi:30S ribosomal protein S6 [Candidatus Falkowbacteria bacterium RIFOXYB2_FULL_47_14]|uniref:Small ribosomal subunit protein bS6 n=1 Tax=Candidatus Falkowbacteria bacterium RIFOXYA2_FULL_47_19 TaxID=1797994 RepID=A0A1F5SGX1_9BACT|nr:MAG: 30S ribosomal protein S6 [Candidatus Falkowbacteria bacterium RIFOXYA2_FULL_47_19]OGF34977.1 MAG: 30S ribosomal protein S6 [Candidatus Falkowbacteria bacterium RIFOXYC2_FULL_46_15]OGF43692.1 MAG: 30S ribosomal protein S6 [Candidatus Falkowbacteria bacterium RIFOXYB2_FULL_47_14]